MKRDRIFAWIMALAVFFLILTASISLPIYIRPFYYLHIDALDLPGVSGFTADQIKNAYDEVLDYLTLPGREFGTGVMACSQQARDHFVDCKVLFDLNAGILLLSAGIVAALKLLKKANRIGSLELGGYGAGFWGAVGILTAVLTVGGLAALDFNTAFVIFHTIFFPGKDNWIFDWNRDQMIRVLPQQFFMNCAILIGAGILVFSLGTMAAEYSRHRRRKKERNHDRQA